VFESAEIDRKLSKSDFAKKVPPLREALLEAQARLREADFSVVIVIAGVEGAGKGDTVNRLLEWIDARGVTSHALGAPSEEESERPPFYRFWRRLPAAGRIGIFFGSWYTWPILEHSFGRIDDARLDRELLRIVEFERMLSAERVLLQKFWLHISKKQQKKRFKQLAADPNTAWRVTPRDWEYHGTYDEFVRSAGHALRATSTSDAAWEIVAARRQRYRHATVAEHLLEALGKRLDTSPPAAPDPESVAAPSGANVLNQLDLSKRLADDDYEKKLVKFQGRLGRLARRMNGAESAAVLVFEGPDAAGKGGCIRRVMAALDSRFYQVIQIAAPTDEESARPYLWRFWRHVPGRGHFTFFDRSWYGRVLVERVEGFCAPADWRRAYAEINAFEEQLVEAGTLVLKFWLAIGADEQLRRFREREKTGHKRYKITPEDWRNREKWAAYETAACDMIEKTSSEIAPWHLVEAEDKHFARVVVLKAVCDALERAVGHDRMPHSKSAGKGKG
jgi:polyphosphate:AMP phosphotransferase